MFTKSIMSALIASISIGSIPEAGHATTINSDINMSESELRASCKRHGGAFTKYTDGTYGCIINKSDGPLVTVSCDADETCIGTRGKQNSARDRKAKAHSEALVVQGATASKLSKKNMSQRGTLPTLK